LKIYTKYILKKLIISLLGGLAIYSLIFLIQNIFVLSEIIIEKKAPAKLSLLYFIGLIPKVVAYTFPNAIVFATFFVTANLAATSELTAINATGISLKVQIKPYIILSIISTIVFVFLQFQLLPESRVFNMNIMKEISTHSILTSMDSSSFNRINETGYFTYKKKNKDGSIEHILMLQQTEKQYSILLAKYAMLQKTDNGKSLIVSIADGNEYIFDYNKNRVFLSSYKKKNQIVPLKIDNEISYREKVFTMTLPEILKKVTEGEIIANGLFFRNVSIALFVFLSPIFAFFFAFSMKRGSSSGGAFFFSLIVAYFYVFFTKMFETMAVKNHIQPALIIAIAPATFAFMTYRLYLRFRHPLKSLERQTKRKFSIVKIVKEAWARLESIQHKHKGTVFASYVHSGFIRLTFFTFGVIEGILILVLFLDMAPLFFKHTNMFYEVIKYSVSTVVSSLPFVLPFSVLIAGLTHFVFLDNKSELTVAKALGISVYSFIKPIFKTILIISFLMLTVTVYFAPKATLTVRTTKTMLKKGKKQLQTNEISYLQPFRSTEKQNVYYHVKQINEQNLEMTDFHSFKVNFKTNKLDWFYRAKKLKVIPKLTATGENFTDFTGNTVKVKPMFFEPSSFFEKMKIKPSEMTSFELLEHIKARKAIGEVPYRFITDYYFRLSNAFAPIILFFVGLPFVFMGEGRKKSPATAFSLGIILLVLYYSFSALFSSLGAVHILSPFLAAWSVNLIFLVMGLYFFTKIKT
jgi:lipopolysaccharide export LptBFGC system permease protein LptF